MKPVLLIDFGSTYTKVVAVCVKQEKLLGSAVAHTTVLSDVQDGLQMALSHLKKQTGPIDFQETFACSSAAGGLKMIASGLVPSLTEKAARLACYGAGAKVIKSYAYELTDEDVNEIIDLEPDIFLLAGGTDGGNKDNIIHNAKQLAKGRPTFPILLAGNRNAASDCLAHLQDCEVYRCDNVMPAMEDLNVKPVQDKIRELFLKQIIHAKGLTSVAKGLADELIPTPSSMLIAMELLAKGHQDEKGLGELIAIDLGGATTDVFSMATGAPKNDAVVVKGLREPFAKRTVEGDLGMRYSIHGIVDAVGLDALASELNLTEEQVLNRVNALYEQPDTLPSNQEDLLFDQVLAKHAVDQALKRHVGQMEEAYTPLGKIFAQTGKDLTSVRTVILTGGSLINNLSKTIDQSLFQQPHEPFVLKPRHANVLKDNHYVLGSMGLLARKYPSVALKLMKKELLS